MAPLLTLVRTFTLTDDTGLVDQAVQTQTQVDDTPPTLNAVAFWPLNCGDSMDALPQPVVLDGCNGGDHVDLERRRLGARLCDACL